MMPCVCRWFASCAGHVRDQGHPSHALWRGHAVRSVLTKGIEQESGLPLPFAWEDFGGVFAEGCLLLRGLARAVYPVEGCLARGVVCDLGNGEGKLSKRSEPVAERGPDKGARADPRWILRTSSRSLWWAVPVTAVGSGVKQYSNGQWR